MNEARVGNQEGEDGDNQRLAAWPKDIHDQLKRKSQSEEKPLWKFPGSLVVRIPGFQCDRPGFNPWLGDEILQAVHEALKTGKEKCLCV